LDPVQDPVDTEVVSASDMVLAGLNVRVVDVVGQATPAPVVILLHGFSMRADDLAPFGASMGLPGLFLFPDGPIDLTVEPAARGRPGRAWWMIDVAARDAAIARGDDRDLSNESPAGLPLAHQRLLALVDQVRTRWPARPLFLGGFSQGAILSLDVVLRRRPPLAGLILLSSARVTAPLWLSLMANAAGLAIFQSHGRPDRELSFSSAESLHSDLSAAGARVTWVPFDGGHEIPLPVWRALKKFIRAVLQGHEPSHDNQVK
jgi:phospholipase/carboxylesterase